MFSYILTEFMIGGVAIKKLRSSLMVMNGRKFSRVIIFISFTFALLFIGCKENPVTVVKDENSIAILIPEVYYEYNSYDIVYVCAKYNIREVVLPNWCYSIDKGKTWEKMTFSSGEISTKPQNNNREQDPDFTYDIHIWSPENDSLSDTEVLFKVFSYADASIRDVIGPIQIN